MDLRIAEKVALSEAYPSNVDLNAVERANRCCLSTRENRSIIQNERGTGSRPRDFHGGSVKMQIEARLRRPCRRNIAFERDNGLITAS